MEDVFGGVLFCFALFCFVHFFGAYGDQKHGMQGVCQIGRHFSEFVCMA
jgi:hypothetical protein